MMVRMAGAAFGIGMLLIGACTSPGAPMTSGPDGRSGPAPSSADKAGAAARGQGDSPSQAQEPINLGYTLAGGTYAALFVAMEEGLFRKYGLVPELQMIRTGAPVLAALENREVEAAVMGGSTAVAAFIRGADHVILGGMVTIHNTSVYGDPSLAKPEDLKGKSIAVTQYGAASDVGLREALRKLGVNPDADLNVVATGGNPESLASLQAGTVQAAVFAPPTTLRAKKMGLRELIDISSMELPYASAAIVTTRSILAEKPEKMEKVLKALAEGVAVFRRDKAAGFRALSKWLQLDDQEVLEETYSFYQNRFQRDLAPTLPGIQAELDRLAPENPRAREAKPSEVIDDRLVRKLKESGFIESLYR